MRACFPLSATGEVKRSYYFGRAELRVICMQGTICMTQSNDAGADYRRRLWMQPNAHLWIRPDAHRFMPPGSPIYTGRDVVKYFWPDPQADRPPEYDRKYRPDQPRVPAGNPDGGQWTEEGSGINDPQVLSDESPDPIRPGAQYAARAPRGGNRPLARQFSGTPRQEAELQATKVRADRAIESIRRVDPNWQPGSRLETPRNIDEAIRSQRDLALESEGHLNTLYRLNITPETLRPNEIGRPMVEGILAPGGVTIGYRIPSAGEEVRTVSPVEFVQVRDQLMAGARPIRTPSDYRGLMFERSDGTSFGLRQSADHGPTIDIIRSTHPLFQGNFKVHQR
jgi:hypothetical protein